MPSNEKSFRIGSGRYIQQSGAISEIGSEVSGIGRSALIIGGETALSLTKGKIEESLTASGLKYKILTHSGSCNENDAQRISSLATAENYDVIVGVGGGVIMDFSKLAARRANKPIVNIPTSSATCAAYTPLSVKYTEEGRTVGTEHFPCEVNAVIADTSILVSQPKRLYLAGVFDAMAKYTEIIHRYSPDSPLDRSALGLNYAYSLADSTRRVLLDETDGAISDMKEGIESRRFSETVFTTICVTGVISGIARGASQTALAHKFYEMTRLLYPQESRPYLHGEIVGVGLLLQNLYNGDSEANRQLTYLMNKHGMPSSVLGVGVSIDASVIAEYENRISHSSSIDPGNHEMCERLHEALSKFFELR